MRGRRIVMNSKVFYTNLTWRHKQVSVIYVGAKYFSVLAVSVHLII